MKLLALLAGCVCLPLAATYLASPEGGNADAPEYLAPRPVRPVARVVERPAQLVGPRLASADRAEPSVGAGARSASVPVATSAPAPVSLQATQEREQIPPEVTASTAAPTGLDSLPPPARALAELRSTLQVRLADQLEPGQSCPASLVHSVHRAGLDPEEISDGELHALYKEHSRLQEQLAEKLDRIEFVLGSALTPGDVVVWEQFEVESDALVASRTR